MTQYECTNCESLFIVNTEYYKVKSGDYSFNKRDARCPLCNCRFRKLEKDTFYCEHCEEGIHYRDYVIGDGWVNCDVCGHFVCSDCMAKNACKWCTQRKNKNM